MPVDDDRQEAQEEGQEAQGEGQVLGGRQPAESTFECSLDKKPFKTCDSPFKKKVKFGKHTFEVQATNSGGGVGDIEKVKFKVLKKKRGGGSRSGSPTPRPSAGPLLLSFVALLWDPR